MAADPGLVQRIQEILASRSGVSERKMFGGIAFMLHGNMLIGVNGTSLMARVGPSYYEQALATENVREMDFTGRPMKGFVYVDENGLEEDHQLEHWIQACANFVSTLPPKPAKK